MKQIQLAGHTSFTPVVSVDATQSSRQLSRFTQLSLNNNNHNINPFLNQLKWWYSYVNNCMLYNFVK